LGAIFVEEEEKNRGLGRVENRLVVEEVELYDPFRSEVAVDEARTRGVEEFTRIDAVEEKERTPLIAKREDCLEAMLSMDVERTKRIKV